MRDLARESGLAVSTISKALRNDPSIPAKRCQEIRLLARKLGYRPNPLVSTLMAQLHHHRRREDPHTLAWIDFWSDEQTGFPPFSMAPVLEGARARAAGLGYGIEVYRPNRDQISMASLNRILKTRNHWGVILPPVPDGCREISLDIRSLAAVTIGTSLVKPAVHRVSPDHFQGAKLAFARLRSHGFKRVGLVLSASMNGRVEGKWLGAFLSESVLLPPPERVAPLIIQSSRPGRMESWVRRQRPDAVLLADPAHAAAWADLSGDPAGVAWLIRPTAAPSVRGVDYNPDRLGILAVDWVVAQIHRNERGAPGEIQTTLVKASWAGD